MKWITTKTVDLLTPANNASGGTVTHGTLPAGAIIEGTVDKYGNYAKRDIILLEGGSIPVGLPPGTFVWKDGTLPVETGTPLDTATDQVKEVLTTITNPPTNSIENIFLFIATGVLIFLIVKK